MFFLDNRKARIIVLVILSVVVVLAIALWRNKAQAPLNNTEEEVTSQNTEDELKMLQEQLEQLIELKEQLENE